MKPRLSLAIVLGGVLVLAGCASTEKPVVETIPFALPAPVAGKGQVVFYRPSGLGPLIRCTVRENGAMVGRVADGHYFILPTDPGPHSFTAKTESTDTLRIEVEPDETSYVKCRIGMGLMVGRPNLSPSNMQEFAKYSSKLKLQDAKKMAEEIAKDEANRTSRDAKNPRR